MCLVTRPSGYVPRGSEYLGRTPLAQCPGCLQAGAEYTEIGICEYCGVIDTDREEVI